ncbi:MAG: methyltransferase domain-containing protein [Leptolyngbyaceae cyanobacterium MO_188.B28]|nr:methyltransferase domain-containing protein [Leptolyngbyaceae cyanobacterium MO_188.B28]
MTLKSYLPWWLKISTKIVMSRLPFSYQAWKKLGLFEHGQMQSATYAYKIFNQHFERVNPQPGFVSLELGPGDSLLSAILSQTFGGSASYFIDSGEFASNDLKIYQEMESFLQAKGLLEPVLTSKASLEEICQNYSAQYLTSGLKSLQSLPSESIDFIWSQAVLEHIKKADFLDTMRELRRVISPNGTCSHVIDLKDHLGGALNNLRFSERVWESEFMAKSGFYTNRIRYSEMIDMFHQADFSVEVIDVRRKWKSLPTPKLEMAKEFRSMPDEELSVSSFSVLLKPN